jgi:transcriptional regulator with PAS, ATPase and Fis domain
VSLAQLAARNDLPVVLCGESGAGKELFAQAIHSASARADGPFVALNCGCIPASLLEAELFGYEPGTFTGARREGNAGKFERADGGTIFLVEVSELAPQAQAALLRVLEEREVVRLGGSSPRRIDARVVAATSQPLPDAVRSGRFRADLQFRINVLPIEVPPLRDRREDVALLARAFLADAEREVGRPGLSFSAEAFAALEAYAWPGNVRELRNVVLRSAATAPAPIVERQDLPPELRAATLAPEGAPAAAVPNVRRGEDGAVDRDALLGALHACGWNVARTAHALNVSRMTLYRWIRRAGIER